MAASRRPVTEGLQEFEIRTTDEKLHVRARSYFGVGEGAGGVGVCGAGVLVVAGPATKRVLVAGGNLSALAQSKLTCHICVDDSEFWKPGIPVIRIPPFTFQYVSPAGSSVTPLPSISLGGLGYIPFAIADSGVNGNP